MRYIFQLDPHIMHGDIPDYGNKEGFTSRRHSEASDVQYWGPTRVGKPQCVCSRCTSDSKHRRSVEVQNHTTICLDLLKRSTYTVVRMPRVSKCTEAFDERFISGSSNVNVTGRYLQVFSFTHGSRHTHANQGA